MLLVDDVCLTGATMAAARERLADRHPGLAVHRLAVFCRPEAEAAVDLAFAAAPADPVFEWSLFRSPVLERACFDLDGILCGDCPAEDDDDGPALPPLPRDRDAAGRCRAAGAHHRHRPARALPARDRGLARAARHRLRPARSCSTSPPTPSGGAPGRRAASRRRPIAADPGAALFVESESWQAREIARARRRQGGLRLPGPGDARRRGAAVQRSLPRRLRRRVAGLGRRWRGWRGGLHQLASPAHARPRDASGCTDQNPVTKLRPIWKKTRLLVASPGSS